MSPLRRFSIACAVACALTTMAMAGIFQLLEPANGIFRTAPERADVPCRYGVLGAEPTNNPLSIALREWVALGRDLLSSRSSAEVCGYLFGPPGWRPDRSATV